MSEDEIHMQVDETVADQTQAGGSTAGMQVESSMEQLTIQNNIGTTASVSAQAIKAQKRVEVKKWTVVGRWVVDIRDQTCSICRNDLLDRCLDCQAQNDPNLECQAAWGTCGHVFHHHCISRWIRRNEVCPLDNQAWQYSRLGL